MKPVDVAIVTPSRFHVVDLANELAQIGHRATVYAEIPRRRLGLVGGVETRTLPLLAFPYLAGRMGLASVQQESSLRTTRYFDRWVSRKLERCDVFHAMSGFATRGIPAARARFDAVAVCDRSSTHILTQDELIGNEHDRWGIPYRPIDPRVIERELEEYEASDVIVTPSEFARSTFLERGVDGNKVKHVGFGVDTAAFHPVEKQDDVFRVLFVGAVGLRKGVPYLLEAVARARRDVDMDFWLVGPEVSETFNVLGSSDTPFTYLGPRPRSELSNYFGQASVVVVPSVEEGSALVVGQALACGVPVIASRNSGAADIIGEGESGFIVPSRDPDAIAERLLTLAHDRDRRDQMAAAALERAASLLSWRDYAVRMLRVYESARSA